MKENKVYKFIWITVGFVCLGIGAVGAVIPFLPSFPFFMGTLFAFAKSSDRLHAWFKSTNLYKKNLESYVTKKAMTMKTKIYILCSVTLVMGFGFLMMKRVPAARIVLLVVWLFHILYFVFGVKTLKEEAAVSEEERKEVETK